MTGPIQQPEPHGEQGMVGTAHHIWHEVLEILGPIGGVLFLAAVGLLAWKFYCSRKAKS